MKTRSYFTLLLMLIMQLNWAEVYYNPFFQDVCVTNGICFNNDSIKKKEKIRKLISKINNNRYSYYDILKADPMLSYIKDTQYKELKGIRYARQIEKIIDSNFNTYATITKNGYFFCLTKEDLYVIQTLYWNWFTNYYAMENKKDTGTSALDGSIYKWECP